MAIVIQMPKLSDTMEEGGVSSWNKKVGDFVAEGDLLLEIETDKATMEYTSPEEGYLLKILVEPKNSVSLGAPIAILGATKDEVLDLALLLKTKKTEDSKTSVEEKKHGKQVSSSNELHSSQDTSQNNSESKTSGRIKASPLAKKLAKEKNISLENFSGTGPFGRIIAQDLLLAQQRVEGISLNSKPPKITATNAPSTNAPSTNVPSTKMPHTMMRKTIAKRLVSAKNLAPHFYLTVSAKMDAVMAWRERLNLSKDEQKVSINDILVLCVAKALKKHPQVNASWYDDYVELHQRVDVCIAVALPEGLITPVVFDADKMSIREVAQASKAVVDKARLGKLTPEEYSGGTFTISNLGMTRVDSFTAIINPPQACILAVGRTQKVPVFNDKNEVVAKHKMSLTLSCDHRVVDGLVGAKFLETLLTHLEDPLSML